MQKIYEILKLPKFLYLPNYKVVVEDIKKGIDTKLMSLEHDIKKIHLKINEKIGYEEDDIESNELY